jgi:hypothetical protein
MDLLSAAGSTLRAAAFGRLALRLLTDWGSALPGPASLRRPPVGPMRQPLFVPRLGKPTITSKKPFPVKHLHRSSVLWRAIDARRETVDNHASAPRSAYNPKPEETSFPQ